MSTPRFGTPLRAGLLGVAALAALVCAAFAVAAGPGDSLPGPNLWRILLGTVVALGIFLLTVRVLPRLGGATGHGGSPLRLVATLAVGQKERVVVVQAGKRQLMIGVAPGRVTLLQQLEEPLELRHAGAVRSAAGPWVDKVLGRAA